jgi:GNAT superfamily N-acetyltransferase
MTDRIVIRPATPADRPFLDSLDVRLIAEAEVRDVTRDGIVAFQANYTRAALDDAKPGAATLIACDGADRPLGYIHLEPEEDFLTGRTCGYISILAVRAEAEGRGIAKHLLEAAEHWAADAGYPFLRLDVFASNSTARRFYAGRGFVEESLSLRRKVGD